MEIKVGCCGFAKGRKKYFEEFKVVEIQQTFYRIPKIKTVEKWREEAPKDFEFTLKAFQGITHDINSPTWRKSGFKKEELEKLKGKVGLLRATKEVLEFWDKMIEISKVLNVNVIIIQLPASFKDTEENIKNAYNFFKTINTKKIKIGIELRGWKEENIKKICKKFGLIDVTDFFRRKPVFVKDICYFRLHGKYKNGKIDYKHKYSKKELKELADYVNSCNVKKAYIMFNNVYMYENAKEFVNLL